jgi:short-subunit dehydrogenase
MKYKKLSEQVLVITGASSGIGLTTAKMAARQGARVVLASRDEESLQSAVTEIQAEGGEAVYVLADVAKRDELEAVADKAVEAFGGFDTWVNNAGVSIYGRILDVPTDDAHRLFETNYWGVVNGSLVAVPRLLERGGVLINTGSVVSDRSIPLQGHYSASKHAVKAFTDALRMELEDEDAPVAVVLIKPAAIDTPFPEHAKNYMEAEPTLPPPVYAPEEVARTILACAERPKREVTVGGGGTMLGMMGKVAPRLGDKFMEATQFSGQQLDRPADPGRPDSLWEPNLGSGREHGDYPGHVMQSSLYTRAALNPGIALIVLSMLGLTTVLASRYRSARGSANASGWDL